MQISAHELLNDWRIRGCSSPIVGCSWLIVGWLILGCSWLITGSSWLLSGPFPAIPAAGSLASAGGGAIALVKKSNSSCMQKARELFPANALRGQQSHVATLPKSIAPPNRYVSEVPLRRAS